MGVDERPDQVLGSLAWIGAHDPQPHAQLLGFGLSGEDPHVSRCDLPGWEAGAEHLPSQHGLGLGEEALFDEAVQEIQELRDVGVVVGGGDQASAALAELPQEVTIGRW